MSSLRTKRKGYPGLEDIDIWPVPDVLVLEENARQDFERKKSAIDQYYQGAPFTEITRTTDVTRQYLYYLLKRCTALNKHGHSVGYFALLKGRHVVSDRHNSLGKLESGKAMPGSLQALFSKYPELRETMHKAIVHGITPDSSRADSRLTWPLIHELFLQQCNALGIRPPSYPFCSDSRGKFSLKNWGKKIIAENEAGNSSLSQRQEEPEARTPPSRVYERVEVDGHFVDVNWILEMPSLTGEGIIRCKVARLWLVAVLEAKSTAAIGYSISLGKNYNAADIAQAIQSTLVPWKPRTLTLSTISYKPEECLPNALIPELSYVCYDELWLDNAKSHLSDIFMTMLERTVNAVPVFGPKQSPNVRPHIELFFDLLEEAGIHCLAGTTGSHPRDPRKSGKDDEPFILQLDLLLDLIDLLIVRYNTGIAPGTTISRNEVLKRAVMRETNIFRRVPKSKRLNCTKYSIFDEAVIGQERGRPIVRWKNARYDGPGLHSAPNLVGQHVLIMASGDLRKIEIVLMNDGTSLGELIVEKRWRDTPHTLFTRTIARRYMTNHSFISHAADIPLALKAHVEKEVKEKRKNQRLLARLLQEQQSDCRNPDSKPQISEPGHFGSTDGRKSASEPNNPLEQENQNRESNEPDYLDALISKLGTSYR